MRSQDTGLADQYNYYNTTMSQEGQAPQISPQKLELAESRFEAATEEYGKIVNLLSDVIKDSSSRLPFIPLFYRTRPAEQEDQYLKAQLPKLWAARGQEFCLNACDKSSKDCMSSCLSFATRAFSLGNGLYAGLHKPYEYTAFQMEEDE